MDTGEKEEDIDRKQVNQEENCLSNEDFPFTLELVKFQNRAGPSDTDEKVLYFLFKKNKKTKLKLLFVTKTLWNFHKEKKLRKNVACSQKEI